MTEGQTVTFNLDHVIEILRNGVRRADVFMGIGLNAAEADPVVSHVLSPDNLHHIKLVKTDLTEEENSRGLRVRQVGACERAMRVDRNRLTVFGQALSAAVRDAPRRG